MKFLRTVFIIAIFSFGLAGLFYYLTDDVVKTASWADSIGEIGVVGAIIFVFVSILYIIFRSIIKGAKAVTKKRPSGQEGLNR